MKYSVVPIAVCLLLLTTGTRLYLTSQQPYPFTNNQSIHVVTHIASEPEAKTKYQRFFIILANKRVQVMAGTFPRYSYNDLVNLSGTISVTKSKSGVALASIRYPKITSIPETNPVYLATGFIRNRAIRTFERTLPPTFASLMLGIVFGIKRNLSDSLLNDLQIAGLMHVIAASGMNVSLVAGALIALLSRLLPRRPAVISSILGVWAYALIAGIQPSIVRASVMGSCALAAQFIGRQYSVIYTLLLTGCLMLLLDPGLLPDIGFQLSFMATAGIILVKPKLGLLTRGRIGAFVGEDITTTLAAQLTTLPILLANFGTMNPFSVIINVLILWTIPILMIIGSIAVGISFVSQQLAAAIVYSAVPMLWYFTTIASLGSKLPLTIHLTSLAGGIIVGYYVCLIAVILWKKVDNAASESGSYDKTTGNAD